MSCSAANDINESPCIGCFEGFVMLSWLSVLLVVGETQPSPYAERGDPNDFKFAAGCMLQTQRIPVNWSICGTFCVVGLRAA